MSRVLILLSLAAAFAAKAEEYTDEKQGFRVTIPKGWTKDVAADGLMVTSPNAEKTFGFCSVHTIPLPGTEGISQATIDQRLTGKFTASYWRKLFEGSRFKNVVIEDAGEEAQNGRNTYFAIVTHKEIRRTYKFKTVVHFLPGVSHHLTCEAYLEGYTREEPAFETFFDSFFPFDRSLTAQAPAAPSAALGSASPNGPQPDASALTRRIVDWAMQSLRP